MNRQFTSTCVVIDEDRFLMIYHPKHKKWNPPGGHLEADETPPEGARREIREETGLEIEFLLQENVWVNDKDAVSIERPFACFLENIPEHNGQAGHQHIDLIFVAKPIGGELTDGRWFTLQEIEELVPGEEIFLNTQELLRKIGSPEVLEQLNESLWRGLF